MLFSYIRRHHNISDVSSHLRNILFFSVINFVFLYYIQRFLIQNKKKIIFSFDICFVYMWIENYCSVMRVYVNNIFLEFFFLFLFFFLNWIDLNWLNFMVFLRIIHVSKLASYVLWVVDWEDNSFEFCILSTLFNQLARHSLNTPQQ